MTAQVMNWIYSLGERDLCSIIGLCLVVSSGIVYSMQGPSRISNSLDGIADAIRNKKG
jgi:hypothetical protein